MLTPQVHLKQDSKGGAEKELRELEASKGKNVVSESKDKERWRMFQK